MFKRAISITGFARESINTKRETRERLNIDFLSLFLVDFIVGDRCAKVCSKEFEIVKKKLFLQTFGCPLVQGSL